MIAGGGFTKVGHSINPEERLAKAQPSNPLELRLVLQVEGGARLERLVIEELRDRHERGEWFRGEIDHEEAVAIVERAKLRTIRGVSAREVSTPIPLCECHGEQMYWSKDPRRRHGGYWRCSGRTSAYAPGGRANR